MITALWVAILTAGGTGMDTRNTFPTERECQAFVDEAYAKSAAKRAMNTVIGVCVRAR